MKPEDIWKKPKSDWVMKANCKGADTELFFHHYSEVQQEVIQTYCNECPVKEECLIASMFEEIPSGHVRFGIRGGMTHVERQKFWKRAQSAFIFQRGGYFPL